MKYGILSQKAKHMEFLDMKDKVHIMQLKSKTKINKQKHTGVPICPLVLSISKQKQTEHSLQQGDHNE